MFWVGNSNFENHTLLSPAGAILKILVAIFIFKNQNGKTDF